MNAVVESVKQAYKVLDSMISGDGETIIVSNGDKNFAVCPQGEKAIVYRCYQAEGRWMFLPNFKIGKAQAVKNFIESRSN